MSYRIALNFEDGATRFIECRDGEKLLDAAYRQKINLPMDCSDGVCGTCKCRCEQGEYDLGDEYVEDALTAEEAGAGQVLTCQMVPSSDCIIAVPVPSSACKLAPSQMEVELVAVERLSANRVRLAVKAAAGALPVFLPGQYVNLSVPGRPDVTRSYSFSSLPGEEVATFLIRNVEGGAMGTYLSTRAAPGDRLTMHGPLGSFYLRAPVRPLLMVAGGTGIAPLLAMLEQLAVAGTNGQAVHLVYSAHDAADLVELDRLRALEAAVPSFSFIATCSGPDETYPVKGRVTSHIGPARLPGGEVDVYLCGPPEMVEAVRTHLKTSDVPVAHLYLEKFLPSAAQVLAL